MENRFRYGKRLYRIWVEMRRRCRAENRPAYANYGGRGIAVCAEWQDYEQFAQWALHNGYSDDLTIERKNVNAGYSPENCTWITRGEQARNRRNNRKLTCGGQTKTAAEWAREAGMEKHTVLNRVRNGMTVSEAISKPSAQRKHLVFGENLSYEEMGRKFGIRASTIKARVKAGMSVEAAVSTPVYKHKAVLQITSDGRICKAWESATEAAQTLGVAPSGISQCCTRKNATYRGYIWRFQEPDGEEVAHEEIAEQPDE